MTGWPLSVDVTDRFRDYCDKTGTEYARSQEGAMIVWLYLPAAAQRLACLQAAGVVPALDREFWEKYLEGLMREVPVQAVVPNEKPRKK